MTRESARVVVPRPHSILIESKLGPSLLFYRDFRAVKCSISLEITLELRSQFRNCVEQVGDQSDVRDLEDRGVFVFVDGDYGFGILHAGQMLDRARDADGDVNFRSDDLAG